MHVVYSHECGGCGAFYIPFDKDIPCPRCGQVEEERFDYIPQAAASMTVNKRQGGRFTPGAWWVGSLGDHILHILFGLFDAYEDQRGQIAFEPFVTAALTRMQWGDQEYMRDHIRDIALCVRDHLRVT